jgi:hypothetical protein
MVQARCASHLLDIECFERNRPLAIASLYHCPKDEQQESASTEEIICVPFALVSANLYGARPFALGAATLTAGVMR